VPGVTEPVVVIVRVDVPAALKLVGEKEAVTPVGSPDVPNVTAELNPPATASVTV
jgi:hypothetical protein